MKADGFKELILQAAYEESVGDEKKLNLLAKHLEVCDAAKQELRNKGYGWTGLDILETVNQVLGPSENNVHFVLTMWDEGEEKEYVDISTESTSREQFIVVDSLKLSIDAWKALILELQTIMEDL